MFKADDKYICQFELATGIDQLEQLQYSKYPLVVKHAQEMLENFFGAQEIIEDEQQNEPGANNAQDIVQQQ